MTSAVEVNGVSKSFRVSHHRYTGLKDRLIHPGSQTYETFWALRDVSFMLEAAETLAVIGANGQGKSTLLQMVGGIIRPTSGEVVVHGRTAALLELGAGFHPDLTGRDNVYMNASILGMSKKVTDSRFEKIVAFAGIERFIDTEMKHYSSGMYVRLGFAVAVHVDADILLVDEVLAVGDEEFQRTCLEKIRLLQREGRSIIFVSHDMELVNTLCDRALLLERGCVVAEGLPVEVIRAYRERIPQASPVSTDA